MSTTEQLKDMLNNLMDGKPEQAQTTFHNYLKDKLHGVLGQYTQPKPSGNTEKQE